MLLPPFAHVHIALFAFGYLNQKLKCVQGYLTANFDYFVIVVRRDAHPAHHSTITLLVIPLNVSNE